MSSYTTQKIERTKYRHQKTHIKHVLSVSNLTIIVGRRIRAHSFVLFEKSVFY